VRGARERRVCGQGEKEKAKDAARSMDVGAAWRIEELEMEESAEREVGKVCGGGAPVAVGKGVSAKAVEEKSLSAGDAGTVVSPSAETSAALTSIIAGEMAERKETKKEAGGPEGRGRGGQGKGGFVPGRGQGVGGIHYLILGAVWIVRVQRTDIILYVFVNWLLTNSTHLCSWAVDM
jgi:hypothetical protein